MSELVLDWVKLQNDLKKERCILMLGPRICTVEEDNKEVPLLEKFSVRVSKRLIDQQIEFEAKENKNLTYIAQQFLSNKRNRRVDLGDLAQDFFREYTDPPPIYQGIAGLPVPVFVNTTPDDYISKALRDQGKEPIVYSYNFYRSYEVNLPTQQFTPERPLVLNLLGNIQEPESLVLSEFDQVDFIRNVVRDNPPIPEEILSKFDENKTYIFLGFNMEHWQFRLLLDSLKLVEENVTVSPQTNNYPLGEVSKSYFEARYRFHFEDQRIEDFVSKVSKMLQSEEEKTKQKVAIGYTDEDRDYVLELEKHLSPLEKNGEIELWYKELIPHGDIDQQIREAMESAEVILLMLSPDFLDKDETYDRELAIAIDAQKEGKAITVPVITRACVWRANDSLRRMKPIPANGLPINSSKWDSPEAAYFMIVKELKDRLGL